MTRRSLLQTTVVAPFSIGQALAGSARQVGLPIDTGGRRLEPFQNGFLTVIERDLRSLTVIDVDGNPVASFQCAIPNASVMAINGVGVSPQKRIVISAGSKSADGRMATSLIFADFGGAATRIVRTSPFTAVRLIFLSDGRLLCIGREYDDRNDMFEDVEGHHILRFYSAEGLLQATKLSINVLRANKRDVHPLNWLPALGQDRIGLLNRETLQYVELDYSGTVIRPLAALGMEPGAHVTGLALLANGDRLVSVEHRDGVGASLKSSFPLYRLKDARNNQVTREVVTDVAPPEGFMGLTVLGVYKDDVVFRTTPVGSLVLAPQAIR